MGNALDSNLRWNVLFYEPVLYVLAQKGDWSALIDRIITHRHEACWIDRSGNTALHLVCRKQPPIEVVVTLVIEYYKAVSMQTIDGMTPLHFACYCGASFNVVKLLIDADHEVVSKRDRRGRTPLHCACAGYRTSDINDVVLELLKVDPTLCFATDDRERSPLYLVLDDYADAVEQTHVTVKENFVKDLSLSDQECKISEDYLMELDQRWVCVTSLLKNAYYGKINDLAPTVEPFILVHACVGIPHCPLSFVFLALDLWPEQVKQRDCNGNLPLHIAASSSMISSPKQLKDSQFKSFIKVINMYSQAARIPDSNGVLPLELAIKSGKTWMYGIRDLLEAFPEAAATLNINFVDYTKILALVGKTYSINFLFCLILAKPEIVNNM